MEVGWFREEFWHGDMIREILIGLFIRSINRTYDIYEIRKWYMYQVGSSHMKSAKNQNAHDMHLQLCNQASRNEKKWHNNDYKIKQSILIEALSNTQDTIDTSWTYQNSSSKKTSSNRLNDKHKTSSLPFGLPHLIAPKFHPPCGTLAAPKNRSFLTFGGGIDDDNIWNISII